MRNPVQKFMAAVVVGVLGALFAVPLVSAGAQTTPGEGPAPEPPGNCKIVSIEPNPVPDPPGFPADITVKGTAPAGVHLTLYTQTPPATGPVVAVAEQDVTDGTFSLTTTLGAAADVSANYTYGNQNAYVAGCADPGGASVVKVEVEAATAAKAAKAAGSLAFTGSSDTPSYVLIGLAALVLGFVFVVAARRRSPSS